MESKLDFISFIKETEGLEESIDFAIKQGILPSKNPHTCIRCESEGSLRSTRNSRVPNLPYTFVCAIRDCRSTVAFARNTIFDRVQFPISQTLRLIYFWILKIPVSETSDQLQLKEVHVKEWFRIFKEICAFVIINYTKPVGGAGHLVEISEYQLLATDESRNVWLFTGVDRATGQNFIIHVEDLESELLWPILKNYIVPGTKVVTTRASEFRLLEQSSGVKETLKFVLPRNSPRLNNHYHLDALFIALENFVKKEMHSEEIAQKELYAYKFLYFNRDGFCNVPASKLILAFISDIKLAYPGFTKSKYYL